MRTRSMPSLERRRKRWPFQGIPDSIANSDERETRRAKWATESAEGRFWLDFMRLNPRCEHPHHLYTSLPEGTITSCPLRRAGWFKRPCPFRQWRWAHGIGGEAVGSIRCDARLPSGYDQGWGKFSLPNKHLKLEFRWKICVRMSAPVWRQWMRNRRSCWRGDYYIYCSIT